MVQFISNCTCLKALCRTLFQLEILKCWGSRFLLSRTSFKLHNSERESQINQVKHSLFGLPDATEQLSLFRLWLCEKCTPCAFRHLSPCLALSKTGEFGLPNATEQLSLFRLWLSENVILQVTLLRELKMRFQILFESLFSIKYLNSLAFPMQQSTKLLLIAFLGCGSVRIFILQVF